MLLLLSSFSMRPTVALIWTFRGRDGLDLQHFLCWAQNWLIVEKRNCANLVAFGAGGIDGFFVLQRGGGAFRAREVFRSRGVGFFVKMDMNGPLRTKGSTTSRCWWSQSITLAPNSGMDAADLEGLSFKREFVAAWEVCVQGSVISWQMVFLFWGEFTFCAIIIIIVSSCSMYTARGITNK